MKEEDVLEVAGWTIRRLRVTSSTNDVARDLPPWHAIVAETQELGRGRHGRKFVCGPGGLWFSAVVPMPGGPARWTGLALAVGWGLLEWLHKLPISSARLRWPNDLMIGNQKLGGILLEQSAPEKCIVGIGINVQNDPAREDPQLGSTVTRLADWVSPCPALPDLLVPALEAVRFSWQEMERKELAGFADVLNQSWGPGRNVEVRPLDGEPVTGRFLGIDEAGALVLQLPEGGGRTFPAHTVERMIEL